MRFLGTGQRAGARISTLSSMLVDFNYFKAHIRRDDGDYDDEYLRGLLEAAEEFVVGDTRRTEEELIEMGGGNCPGRIRQAVCLIGAHWDNQRETVASTQMSVVPYTYDACVKPFRKLVKE